VDPQTLWSAALVIPAVVLTLLAIPARRQGRTRFGLGVRDGAVGEFLRGCLFSLPFLGVLALLFPVTGLTRTTFAPPDVGRVVAVVVYFLVLMLVEEVVFRGMLMTGLGVLTGRTVSWIVTALLVAGAYLLAPQTGVLPMIGAVITNLLHGWVRWRSGRIWWGWGQRWVWNAGAVALGFSDSGFRIQHPLLHQELLGPDWLTGGAFGVEGGVVGILFLLGMFAASTRFARGRTGEWTITRATSAHE
jgi:uncharacterized protein